MKHRTRCTVPGCTRDAVTLQRIILLTADTLLAKRAVCADPACRAIVRRSLETRTDEIPIDKE